MCYTLVEGRSETSFMAERELKRSIRLAISCSLMLGLDFKAGEDISSYSAVS